MSDANNQTTAESPANTPPAGAIVNPKPIDGKPWTDKATLEQHLDDGARITEMTAELGVSRVELLKWIRAYDLEPNYGKNITSRYSSTEDIPVVINSNNIEHAIPATISERLGLDGGTVMRFTPRLDFDSRGVTMELEAGEGIDGSRSNERTLARRNTRHLVARYPTRLAAALGLYGYANDAAVLDPDDSRLNVSIEVTSPEDARMTVTFKPNIRTKSLAATVDEHTAVGRLDSVAKTLWATPDQGSGKYTDLDIDDDFHLRLDLPVASADGGAKHRAYVDAYELEPGQKVGLRLGKVLVDGAHEYGIIVDTDPDLDAVHDSQVATLNKKDAGLGQLAMYPGMTLLHSLGIGTDTVEPKIRLVPGDGEFGIIAASEDASTLVSEQRVREAVEGAETWDDVAEALGVSFPTAQRYAFQHGYDLNT